MAAALQYLKAKRLKFHLASPLPSRGTMGYGFVFASAKLDSVDWSEWVFTWPQFSSKSSPTANFDMCWLAYVVVFLLSNQGNF